MFRLSFEHIPDVNSQTTNLDMATYVILCVQHTLKTLIIFNKNLY